jgi:ubiquinone/menaquinone biosynthesis C-methylase UbiE
MKPDPDSFPPVPLPGQTSACHQPPKIPEYLQKVYWWAYLHPRAVWFFEREWLVNLILWGNFKRLRNMALAELGREKTSRVLQIACVYGDFTQHLLKNLQPDARLDIVDVAPIQLANLQRKLPDDQRVHLWQQDSSHLDFPDATFDTILLFFLLHEQPEEVRRATLAEALRVTRPGGRIVIVDYHSPRRCHPLYYPMRQILRHLEPFALDLWQHEISAFLPATNTVRSIDKTSCFGGLYQKIVIRC